MSENKKPRLAEILGVEVGEKFDIEGRTFSPYMVTDKGFVIDSEREIDYEVVTYLLNDLSRLIRCPRWTEQDKEDAKALKRLIPNASHVWRHNTSSSLRLYDAYGNYILTLNDCFATLPLRESATLDEIIGDEDNDS